MRTFVTSMSWTAAFVLGIMQPGWNRLYIADDGNREQTVL